ncbi:hypothetical protein F5Y18DRAFT_155147 [Xylariaceae sp. FL1019]|nr:hypothetical protein F5Y18DRAFT_155147 [Xylariaceae sp. FL1019]
MKMDQRLVEIRDSFSAFSLSPSEARYLKMLCSSIKTDVIRDLPVEIVGLISLHLDDVDLANCLRVSKAWRGKLLSDHVIRMYGRAGWPNLCICSTIETPSSFIEALIRVGWFRRRCRYMQESSSLGDPRKLSISELPLDTEYHPSAEDVPSIYLEHSQKKPSGPPFFYSHGKAAWCPESQFVCVDDLRLRTRKVFTPPSGILHGQRLALEAFGSKLAVATIGRLIIAWNHITNKSQEKQLPYLSYLCQTHDDQVGVILRNGNILVWTLNNNKLTRIDTSPSIWHSALDVIRADQLRIPTHLFEVAFNLFFDRQSANTCYIATARRYAEGQQDVFDMEVHEFSMTRCVNSWKSCEPLPRASMPLTVTTRITNYEIERSCILFHTPGLIQVFDLNRRQWRQKWLEKPSTSIKDYCMERSDLYFSYTYDEQEGRKVYSYIEDSPAWRKDNLIRYYKPRPID